ncbi:hypothetical protein [Hyphomonas sp.]|uniref:hypothetical protein n=1 Tax=Hyphomonas sp. TaxID=87 RepID=UPI0030012208
MTDQEVEDRLRTLAIQKGAPFLKGEVPYPNDVADDVSGSIILTLWDLGYLQSVEQLRSEGASQEQIDRSLDKARPDARREDWQECLVSDGLSDTLCDELRAGWDADQGAPEFLTERRSGVVKEFEVIFRSNESQHRGRPHVVAVLRGVQVSISLDDPPTILAPKQPVRGSANALKVIKKYRKKLIKEWHESRPDDQNLPASK